jgi:hypothetical protein
MEPEGSLLCLQESTVEPGSLHFESSPHLQTHFIKIHINILSSHVWLGPQVGSSLQVYQLKFFVHLPSCYVCCICDLPHLFWFDHSDIFDETSQYASIFFILVLHLFWSSWSFFIVFSDILNLCSSLGWDTKIHIHLTFDKIMFISVSFLFSPVLSYHWLVLLFLC